ncbi:hypothetical protein KC929_00085 [Patescibacteria group bacterium]|nr:hypothetical protein [Patescibacteria group bacterium]
MIFGEKTRTEDAVIEALDKQPESGPDLLRVVQEIFKPSLSKQGLYSVLRNLQKSEVITKTKNHYGLNRVWLQKIRKFSERHIHKSESVDEANVLDFEDGDSVTYRFKNPFLMDVTWGHLYDILYEANPTHQVMLNYHPHEWLMLSRPETERYWLNRFKEDKKMLLFTISGNSALDKKFQKDWSSEYVKINIGESYDLKSNQYLSVVGDYIFEITTDPLFEERVNKFFKENDYLDESAQKQIASISKQKYKSKLKLSKNKKKADAWRKKYKKDFYVPKPYYFFEE